MEMRHLRVRLRLRYRCDLYRGGAIHVGLPQVLEHLCGARFALAALRGYRLRAQAGLSVVACCDLGCALHTAISFIACITR